MRTTFGRGHLLVAVDVDVQEPLVRIHRGPECRRERAHVCETDPVLTGPGRGGPVDGEVSKSHRREDYLQYVNDNVV